jgi:hypothetical protein
MTWEDYEVPTPESEKSDPNEPDLFVLPKQLHTMISEKSISFFRELLVLDQFNNSELALTQDYNTVKELEHKNLSWN